MKNGFKHFSKFKELLSNNTLKASKSLLKRVPIKDQQSLVTHFLFSFLINLQKSVRYKIENNTPLEFEIEDEANYLSIYKSVNPNYEFDKAPYAVITRKRLNEFFGAKLTKGALNTLNSFYLRPRAYSAGHRQYIFNKDDTYRGKHPLKAFMIINEKDTDTKYVYLDSINMDEHMQKSLKRFFITLQNDLNTLYQERPEAKAIVEGMFRLRLPKKELKSYLNNKIDYVYNEVIKNRDKYDCESVETYINSIDKFIEWQTKGNYLKFQNISTCIGDRIYTPANRIPKQIRNKLVFNRRKSNGKLKGIDIKSSVPTILYNKIMKFIPQQIKRDNGNRHFYTTIEKAIESDLLLRSVHNDLCPYQELANIFNISRDKAKTIFNSTINGSEGISSQKVLALCPVVDKYKKYLNSTIDKSHMDDDIESWNEWEKTGKDKPGTYPTYFFYKRLTHDNELFRNIYAKRVLKRGRYQSEKNQYRHVGVNCTPLTKNNLLFRDIFPIESDLVGLIVSELYELGIHSFVIFDEIRVEEQHYEKLIEISEIIVKEYGLEKMKFKKEEIEKTIEHVVEPVIEHIESPIEHIEPVIEPTIEDFKVEVKLFDGTYDYIPIKTFNKEELFFYDFEHELIRRE